jgi:hypothetical protein
MQVAAANASKLKVTTARYDVTATAGGGSITLTLSPAFDGASQITGSYTASSLSLSLAGSGTVVLQRGKYSLFHDLVLKDATILLG